MATNFIRSSAISSLRREPIERAGASMIKTPGSVVSGQSFTGAAASPLRAKSGFNDALARSYQKEVQRKVERELVRAAETIGTLRRQGYPHRDWDFSAQERVDHPR